MKTLQLYKNGILLLEGNNTEITKRLKIEKKKREFEVRSITGCKQFYKRITDTYGHKEYYLRKLFQLPSELPYNKYEIKTKTK